MHIALWLDRRRLLQRRWFRVLGPRVRLEGEGAKYFESFAEDVVVGIGYDDDTGDDVEGCAAKWTEEREPQMFYGRFTKKLTYNAVDTLP